jgi:uncharacterized protein (DUF1499 family)
MRLGIVLLVFPILTYAKDSSLGEIKELKKCPSSPNCVSTMTTQEKKKMPPIPYKGEVKQVIQEIIKVVMARPRTKKVNEQGNYVAFTFKSKVFRFVDDVEFLIDTEASVVHFRSASRLGYSDGGVNRSRMQELSDELAKKLQFSQDENS